MRISEFDLEMYGFEFVNNNILEKEGITFFDYLKMKLNSSPTS